MKNSRVSDAELNGMLAIVKHGYDPEIAKSLIEYFYERMRDSEPYSERILFEYLSHAFGKIIDDDWSADHAFGFKLKRGNYQREDTTTMLICT